MEDAYQKAIDRYTKFKEGLTEKEELVAEEGEEDDDQGSDPIDDLQNDDHLETYDDSNLN